MIPYKHEPFTDFSKEESKLAFQAGLQLVDSYLGRDYPLVIGRERLFTTDKIVSVTQPIKKKLLALYQKQIKNLQSKRCKRRSQHFKLGKKQNQKLEQIFCLKQQPSFVEENMNSPLCWLKKQVNLGMKQMQIQQKQLTFLNTTVRQMLKFKDGKPVESRSVNLIVLVIFHLESVLLSLLGISLLLLWQERQLLQLFQEIRFY